MHIKKSFCLIALIAVILSACSDKSAPAPSDSSASILPGHSSKPNTVSSSSANDPIEVGALYAVVYSEQQTGYTIISSDLLDTLFIAGALYYDFESGSLCPDSSPYSYADVREYFTPYKTHPFMQGFEKYTDDMIQDVSGEVIHPLVYHILTSNGFNQWSNSVFADAEEVNTFIDGLKQFYQDTGAEEFLKNSSLRQDMLPYLPDAAGEMPIAEYLHEVEVYVGNKERLFGNANLHYYNLITPFRPRMASFYDCILDQDIYFVAQLAPYSFVDGSLDIREIVETSIHEYLHLFVNDLVAGKAELIDTLTKDLNPADYTSQLYIDAGHPWNRIIDEAVVPAVQAGIYRQVYGDSERAYQELLVKELNGGIVNLDKMYGALSIYEANRDSYPTIDAFIDTLIRQYLQRSDEVQLPSEGSKENPAVFDMTDPDAA